MSKISYIKEEVILSATPSTPDTGYVKRYQKTDGLWYDLDSTGVERVLNWELLKPIVIAQPTIVVHNGAANTSTNVVTQNVTIPFDGDYLLNLSFNYNIGTTNSNGRWYATFNGNALDLNDRISDPQGVNQILVTRVRNASDTSGGAITGTGSGNKFNYSMSFGLTGLTAGTYSFVLDCGNQTADVNTSTWNVIGEFKIINLT